MENIGNESGAAEAGRRRGVGGDDDDGYGWGCNHQRGEPGGRGGTSAHCGVGN